MVSLTAYEREKRKADEILQLTGCLSNDVPASFIELIRIRVWCIICPSHEVETDTGSITPAYVRKLTHTCANTNTHTHTHTLSYI